MFRDRFAAGHGGFPLVGTPDHIADELEKLSATGVAGTTLAFVDYAKEFPFFAQEVIPRLERKKDFANLSVCEKNKWRRGRVAESF